MWTCGKKSWTALVTSLGWLWDCSKEPGSAGLAFQVCWGQGEENQQVRGVLIGEQDYSTVHQSVWDCWGLLPEPGSTGLAFQGCWGQGGENKQVRGVLIGEHDYSTVLQQYRRRLSVCAIRSQSVCLLSSLGQFSKGTCLAAQRQATFKSREESFPQDLPIHLEALVRGPGIHKSRWLHNWLRIQISVCM